MKFLKYRVCVTNHFHIGGLRFLVRTVHVLFVSVPTRNVLFFKFYTVHREIWDYCSFTTLRGQTGDILFQNNPTLPPIRKWFVFSWLYPIVTSKGYELVLSNSYFTIQLRKQEVLLLVAIFPSLDVHLKHITSSRLDRIPMGNRWYKK